MGLPFRIPLFESSSAGIKPVPPRQPSMRRAALIYNPFAGQHFEQRRRVIAQALQTLGEAGVQAEALETTAPGTAGPLALEAAARGCDAILACGGDGTVHEILQHLVGTGIALGVVPLGTANALAMDLGLGASPARALRKLLYARPVQVPVGRIRFRNATGQSDSRFFTVAAGVGVDALFMSRLDPVLKRQFGYALYMFEGLRVWATHTFPLFQASFTAHRGQPARVEQISQLLAVRIRDFGGALHSLAPGASLHKKRLQLVVFKTRSRFHYLRFLLAVIFRRQSFSQRVELLEAASVECNAPSDSAMPVYVEADGELLGSLPARIEMAEAHLTLLVPDDAQP